MFLFLSKFLPPFIYPLGLVSLLVIAAFFLHKKVRLLRSALLLALAILLLGSNRLVAASLVRSLEYQHLPPAEIANQPATKRLEPLAPVIVLLGGGTEPAASPRHMVELNGAGDRVLYAALLYRLGYAPNILVSGGNLDWLPAQRSPAEDMADLLVFLGVPREVVWIENESRNTYENAVFTHQILAERNIQKIILVTSAQHMPRAFGLYKKQGFEVLPGPADFAITELEWQRILHPLPADFLLSLLPDASNLNATTNALKEYLGILVYRLQGWMG